MELSFSADHVSMVTVQITPEKMQKHKECFFSDAFSHTYLSVHPFFLELILHVTTFLNMPCYENILWMFLLSDAFCKLWLHYMNGIVMEKN